MTQFRSRDIPARRKARINPISMLKYLTVGGMFFYTGCLFTSRSFIRSDSNGGAEESLKMQKKYESEIATLKKQYKEALEKEKQNAKELSQRLQSLESNAGDSNNASAAAPLYDNSLYSLAQGISKIPRQDFLMNFDYGTPSSDATAPVLMIHHGESSLPITNPDSSKLSTSIVDMSAKDATENCDFMHVVTVPNRHDRMCTAIVQNYENWHVQKWMKRKLSGGPLDTSEPLRVVNRAMDGQGRRHFRVPEGGTIRKHWKILQTYFENFDAVVEELKPIARKVAVDNTIIVMTCNKGQSELLMNFVCNAKAKGLDVSNVLVFPTDQETMDLAEGLGLTTFHDEKNFGALPKGEAKRYGDLTFTAMMFAKVVCVQLINHLGYDLLFQDVDVVWYKNPLEYFHNKENEFYNFDMYYQDDGAHTQRYAPYSANSGFYYVRNTPETRYFFVSLLYAGDIIITSKSHQQALIQIMTEHASQFGLKVKVLKREMEEFPGGWHYHSRKMKNYMKGIAGGDIVPYIFHMSWTTNKDNKIKYFQQMGEWYTSQTCIQSTKKAILGGESDQGKGNGEDGVLFQPCCMAEPEIVCHYRDKPSKVPCKDSPPIDKGRPSFW